jgi:hypothetical protein
VVLVKKRFSCARASAHVIPVFRSFDPGCFTVNHPFASGSASFRIKRSQFSSSPDGIRSGLVRTPTYNGGWSAHFLGEDGSKHTDRPLPLWVMLLRNGVRTLVLEIGYKQVSLRDKNCIRGLTFTSDSEEDQTTWFTNIGSNQILDEVDIGGISTLADASDQTFSNPFSSKVNRKWG